MKTNKSIKSFLIIDKAMMKMAPCVEAYTKIGGKFKEEELSPELLALMVEASSLEFQEVTSILDMPFWPDNFRYLEPGAVMVEWMGCENLLKELSRNRYNEEQKLTLLRELASSLHRIHTSFWDISMGVM